MHFARVCQQERLIRPSVPLQSDLLVHPHLPLQSPVCLLALGLTTILTTVEIEIASGTRTANAKYGIDNVTSAIEIASVHPWRTLVIQSVSRQSA